MDCSIGVECPNCGEVISKRVAIWTDDEVVTLGLFSCQSWKCDICGCIIGTPDESSMYEVFEEGKEDYEIPEDDEDFEEH
jgi:hypothetical protein